MDIYLLRKLQFEKVIFVYLDTILPITKSIHMLHEHKMIMKTSLMEYNWCFRHVEL